jgi:hypothetical protein
MKKYFVFAVFMLFAVTCFSQDYIYLKTGEVLEVTVLEEGALTVRYRYFDDTSKKMYFAEKSDIYKIVYPDGKEVTYNKSERKEDVFADDVVPEPGASRSHIQSQEKAILYEPYNFIGFKIYDSDGVQLSKYEVRSLMRNVPMALGQYNSGYSFRAIGLVLNGIAAVSGVMGIYQIIKSYDDGEVDINLQESGLYWCAAMLLSAIPMLIFYKVGSNKINKSVDTYNREIKQRQTTDVSLNFGITQSGGIGFTLNF